MSSGEPAKPALGKVGLRELLTLITSGNSEPDVAEVVAWQLVELNKRLSTDQRARLTDIAGGRDLGEIARGIIEALDPKRQSAIAAASKRMGHRGTSLAATAQMMLHAALRPIRSNAELREAILSLLG